MSIIVPCHNSSPFIARTLGALARQVRAYPDVELLLVDNLSTDDTLELLRQAANELNAATGRRVARVLRATNGQGVNVARNCGASAATGQLLLFTDHDDAVSPGWVAAYRARAATGAELMAGPYTELLSNGEVVSEVIAPETHLWDIPYGLGSNCAITRRGFELIGGFRPQWVGGGDDADFFWRAHFAGLVLVFVPEARIRHFMRDDEAASFRQYRGYGRAAVRLFAEFHRRGMPRSSTLRAALAWPVAALELATSAFGLGSRRRALARLGVRWGRLTESCRLRVLYL